MGAERRIAERKSVDCIHVNDLTSVHNYMVIAREGYIVDASSTGFLMEINRSHLVPEELRENLTLEAIVGQQVVLYLPQMNLDLDGVITRANHVGKGLFHVAIEFSNEVPEYWRECLCDLLPAPGEVNNE